MKIEIDHDNADNNPAEGEEVEVVEEVTKTEPTPATPQPQPVTPQPAPVDPRVDQLESRIAQLENSFTQLTDALNKYFNAQGQGQVPQGQGQGMEWLGPVAQLLGSLFQSRGGSDQLTSVLLGLAIDNLKSSAELNRAVAGAVVKKLLGEAIASELGEVVVSHE